MDKRLKDCLNLTERDINLIYKIEEGMSLAADVSRADALLCCLLTPQRALIISHARPNSISSLYRRVAEGQVFTPEEQPLLFRVLRGGSGGQRRRQVLSSGAPAIQDVQPIRNAAQRPVGAVIFESNMIEYERSRRRDRSFRRAVHWLQAMCLRGELDNAPDMVPFGAYDGIYLVDQRRCIDYMSGIATNLFRSIGRVRDVRGQPVSALEEVDAEIVDHAFESERCIKTRLETEDGRVWVRKAIPLRAPQSTLFPFYLPYFRALSESSSQHIDAALVLVHNATEAVQKERELNVKSAIIQEVHHRVKNNLQTIAAMMRIQARRSQNEEAKQMLSDAVNRVLSMSVIHEFLSQDEHQPINVRRVCQRIAEQVVQVTIGQDQQVLVEVEGPNIRLPAGQATPTAMVVNELLLNAIEHGLGARDRGHIHVELRDLGDKVQIRVRDDGSGLPHSFNPAQSHSLGLQIVNTLVTDDLKGTFTFETVEMAETPEMPKSANKAIGDSAIGVQANTASDPVSDPVDEAVIHSASEAPPNTTAHGTCAVVTFPKRSLSVE